MSREKNLINTSLQLLLQPLKRQKLEFQTSLFLICIEEGRYFSNLWDKKLILVAQSYYIMPPSLYYQALACFGSKYWKKWCPSSVFSLRVCQLTWCQKLNGILTHTSIWRSEVESGIHLLCLVLVSLSKCTYTGHHGDLWNFLLLLLQSWTPQCSPQLLSCKRWESATQASLYYITSRPLAPVVQTLDNVIHRINHYPVDKY